MDISQDEVVAEQASQGAAAVEFDPNDPLYQVRMPDRGMGVPDPNLGVQSLAEFRQNRRQLFQIDYQEKEFVESREDEMLQRSTPAAYEHHRGIEEYKAMIRRRGLTPLWRELCGIDAKEEKNMMPARRRQCLKNLIGAVSNYVRAELRIQDASPQEFGERSYLWDPVRSICFHFEIARPPLNNYCRELTGMSVTEIVDKIRAEKIRGSLREEIRGFMAEWRETDSKGGADISVCSNRAGRNTCPTLEEVIKLPLREARWHVWKAFKRHRRENDFDRSEFAIRFEIPTHRRLFRACLLCYRKSPYQLEMEAIDEVLGLMIDGEQRTGENSKIQIPNSKENDKGQTKINDGAEGGDGSPG